MSVRVGWDGARATQVAEPHTQDVTQLSQHRCPSKANNWAELATHSIICGCSIPCEVLRFAESLGCTTR
jgi:hypothetical protein